MNKTQKPILIFNRKESECGYPYTKYYNLVKVNVERDVSKNGHCYGFYYEIEIGEEIKIHSSEEHFDYMKIFGEYGSGNILYNCNGELHYYDCEHKELVFCDELKDRIKEKLKDVLIKKFVQNYY